MFQEALNSWPEFIKQFDFHPETGFLIHPTHQVTSFDYSKLLPILQNLSNCQSVDKLEELFETFPNIQLKQQRNNVDLIILRDSLSFVLQYFLLYCRLIRRQIKQSILPKNIALPLYIAANQLKVKYGMCMGQQTNWIPLNNNYLTQNFSLQDFKFRVYLTNNLKGQMLVQGVAIVTSFYLAKIIKLIFQMNKIIEIDPMKTDLVIERLQRIEQHWKKINVTNLRVLNQLEKDFFWDELRPMFSGFNDLIFQGVQNGQNKSLSSTGGAGGNDPSYQIFQRGFGIIYQGAQCETQKILHSSMTKNHISFITYYQQNSLVRQYCKCTKPLREAYNSVIAKYSQFLETHSSFIQVFLLKHMLATGQGAYGDAEPDQKGLAGVEMRAIMKRFETVRKFYL